MFARAGWIAITLLTVSALTCSATADDAAHVAVARGGTPAATSSPAAVMPTRDGSHDFDFNIGVWHTRIKRILDPLAGGTQSVELQGTVSVRPLWGGRAELEEIETEGPQGHWEGLTLFLYNPQSHQWSQSFINSKSGTLSTPLVGAFTSGRGELFSQDTFHDQSILVRGVWSDITADSHSYTESYSADGGHTWSPAFIAHLTREHRKPNPESALGALPVAPGGEGHEFDFDFGQWQTHSSRLLHPLTGSGNWVELDGHTTVHRVWGGRANLAEYKATGPQGLLELLALRWFNPVSHQWNIDFATPAGGTLGIPAAGKFNQGRADFYDYEPVNGTNVLVRFSIWGITADTAQSEQAFSADGGKTWEVNWVNRYQRLTGAASAPAAAQFRPRPAAAPLP